MFIGQCSSIIGVCVVYGLSSLVHPFYCLYKPLIDEKERIYIERGERANNINIQREREREVIEEEIDCEKRRRSKNRLISVLT
jgi:hypothetical protein